MKIGSHLPIWISTCLLLVLAQACNSDTQQTSSPSVNVEAYDGPKLFQNVLPANSGINFVNHVDETWDNNILINSYLYNGGGVAVLDVNNDGLEDLYFTATMGPNALYINKGDWKFEEGAQAAGVTAADGIKTGVSVVDINADGSPDLYVTRTGMEPTDVRRNLLFINDGTGKFTEQAAAFGLNDPSASNHANFFDFDQDGDLDVYVLNHPIDFSRVNSVQATPVEGGYERNTEPWTTYDTDRLYENRDGKFVDVTEAKGLINRAWGLSVTASDLNADGITDLYIGNDYIEPDQVIIGKKGGQFEDQTDQWLRHMSNHTMGVDIADINGDAKPDVVSLDMLAPDLERRKRLMTTMIQERFNSLKRYGYKNQLMRNTVQMNSGDGFSDQAQMLGMDATDWSWAPLIADFDLNGKPDLYVTNGYRRDVSNLDYLTYTVDSVKRTGGLTKSRFGSFDKYADLIPTSLLPNYAYAQQADGTFKNTSAEWGINQPTYSTGAAYADLDNDGDLDLIVNNIDGKAGIFSNQARERGNGHSLVLKLTGDASNTEAIGATVRVVQGDAVHVQELRRTRGFFSAVTSKLVIGLASAKTIDSVIVRFPNGASIVQTDVKVDQTLSLSAKQANGKTSVASLVGLKKNKSGLRPAKNTGLSFTHVENEFEDFGREPLIPHRVSKEGPALAVADINGDGRDDVFVGGALGQAAKLFVQGSNSRFSESSQKALAGHSDYEDTAAAFFDADGDGDLDLYVVSGGSTTAIGSSNYQDRLYQNDGGKFTYLPEAVTGITSPGSCVQPFDVDGDGDLDLFVGGRVNPGKYPLAPRSYILRNDGGTFADATSNTIPVLAQAGMVTSATLAELAGDETPELILTGEWMAPRAFSSSDGKWAEITEWLGLNEAQGWYNCVVAHDQDGDGKDDLLLGNVGLNSRHRAPIHIYASDYDHNGQIDPVLAVETGGQTYPLATRDAILKQMPVLKKQFQRYSKYATATLEEAFGAAELEKAMHLTANNLESSIWKSSTKKLEALPLAAQAGPVNCILPIGNSILLGGHNLNVDAETGRLDALNGVLMVGDKVVSDQLGLSLDLRDMKVVTLANGKTLVVVANNDAPMQVFEWMN
ncbi:MAG: CRTAC1 family protein [Saprospiraceae bacterium]